MQRVADLKKAKPRDDQAIEQAEATIKELTRESRDLAAKAKEIEDAVYDLKAVNPPAIPAEGLIAFYVHINGTAFWPFSYPFCSDAGLPTTKSSKISRAEWDEVVSWA